MILNLYSIFNSISGEVGPILQGSFCTFIRFAGCSLNCEWCDTKYARSFTSGQKLSIQEVLGLLILEHTKNPTGNFVITGGEPLEQEEAVSCLIGFIKRIFPVLFGKSVCIQIETNGTIVPKDSNVQNIPCVVDIKPPSAGPNYQKGLPFHEVYAGFAEGSYIKFLVGSKRDYQYAKAYLDNLCKGDKVFHYAFSAIKGMLSHNDLYQWILNDGLAKKYSNIILNAQLHKELNLREHN